MRLPTPVAGSFQRSPREYTPASVPGLAAWYPIRARQWEDSARTILAGVGSPVGARDDFSGNLRHLIQGDTAKKPTLVAEGPAFTHVDDLMSTTLDVNPMSLQFAWMMSLWGKDGSDSFAPLREVQTGVWGLPIADGDDFRVPMAGNWDADGTWCVIGLVLPDFDNDAVFREFVRIRIDSDNEIEIWQTGSGNIAARFELGGTEAGANAIAAPGFTAGSPIILALRYDGTQLHLSYAELDAPSLTIDTETASLGTEGVGVWVASIGQFAGSNVAPGAHRWLVTNDGSSAEPITDLFGGMTPDAWRTKWDGSLVIELPYSTDGASFTIRTTGGGTVSPSVASRAVPSRVPWSLTTDGEIGPFVYVAIAEDERIEVGYRNAEGASDSATSVDPITIAAHGVSVEFDGTTLRVFEDLTEVVSLAVSGTFTGLNKLNVGGMSTTYDGHPFDERIGDCFLHTGGPYSTFRRRLLHNYLAGVTEGLAEAV